MSLVPASSEGMTASPSECDPWLSEGFANLERLRQAALLAPSPALTAKISRKSASLRELLAQHHFLLNTCASPLLRIPHEIQQHIFAYAAAGEHIRRWIRLGQICSTLRKVLLGFHSLWGDAIYSWSDGRHRDKILERAGPSTPLVLQVHSHGSPDASEFAKHQLYRARSINASDPSFVQHIVDADIPSLPCLEFALLAPDVPIQSALNRPPRNTPRLKIVRMHAVFWHFCAPGLTELAIYYIAPTHTQLFNLLLQSKFLKKLTLRGCIPALPAESVSNVVVSFPFLEHLSVGCHQARALEFWRLLRVPTDTKLEFVFEDRPSLDPSRSQDIGSTRSLILYPFKQHLKGRPPLKLSVFIDREKQLCFSIFLGTDSTSKTKERAVVDSRPALRVCYPMHGSANAVKAWEVAALDELCEQLDLDNIEHFCRSDSHVHWDAEEDAHYQSYQDLFSQEVDYWVTLLRRFEHLKYLDISDLRNPLCTALSSPPVRSSPDTSNITAPPLLLPRLQHLTVRDTGIEETQYKDPNYLWTENFLSMVRLRATQTRPLSSIQFHGTFVVPSEEDDDATEPFLAALRLQNPNCQVVMI